MIASAVIADAPHPPAPSPLPSGAPWPLWRRIAFRFVFSYLVLYSFELATNSDFGWDWLTLVKLWHAVVPWIGKHVLHLHPDITIFTNGSGDTRYDWLLTGTWAVAALVAAAVWSIVDRRRLQYERLHRILRVWVRYALAYQMLLYGFDKLFKLQFPMPGPRRLIETFGEASPMGLLWAFMGASTPYTIFAGAAEVLGGMLLYFRRTTTLGALVVAGVMTNVVMLNFCYDVPVKILSSHLLLLAVWLLLPDARRLADVLVFHRPTQPALTPWRPLTRGGRWARGLVKYGLIVFLLGYYVRDSVQRLGKHGDIAPRPPYYGAYDVEQLARNGQVVPQVLSDAKAWRAVAFERTRGAVRFADGAYASFDLPPKDGAVELAIRDHKYKLRFATPDADHVVLSGKLEGDELKVTLRKVPRDRFLLLNRGFHLVNEDPFNR